MAVAMVVLKTMLPQSEKGVFNAESSFMLRADIHRPICNQVEGFSLRITGVAFSIAIN